LTPLIDYRQGFSLLDFDSVFNVTLLQKRYNVVSMEKVEPARYKTLSCNKLAMQPGGYPCKNCDQKIGCKLEGSPNIPYWKGLGFMFEESFDIGQSFQMNSIERDSWIELNEDMVLMSSFMSFPSSHAVNTVHQYLEFIDEILQKAEEVVAKLDPFTSIHLRNGRDWQEACNLIKIQNLKKLFSSNQCTSSISYNQCFQSFDEISTFLSKKSPHQNVFVSTDYQDYKTDLSKKKTVYTLEDLITVEKSWQKPFIELAIHSKSNLFIANCVSSFSAFAVKKRRVNNLPVNFWNVYDHDEL